MSRTARRTLSVFGDVDLAAADLGDDDGGAFVEEAAGGAHLHLDGTEASSAHECQAGEGCALVADLDLRLLNGGH